MVMLQRAAVFVAGANLGYAAGGLLMSKLGWISIGTHASLGIALLAAAALPRPHAE